MASNRSLLALAWLAFFMADVRDGLGPFLATYLQARGVQQELIGYTMTAGGLAAVAMTPFAGAWVDSSRAKRAMTVAAALVVTMASGVAFSTLAGPWLIASQVVTGLAGAMLGATLAACRLRWAAPWCARRFAMAGRDDGRFRLKPAAPKSRAGPGSQRFISQVLKKVSKAGAKRSGKNAARPANTFGRGRVAATMAGRRLGANARRVIIKSRFVVLRRASSNSVAVHLRYIERDGVTRDGQKGQAYGQDSDAADLKAFQERGQGDRHQFRFIVSPEDGLELEDLRGFTRQLMRRMEIDLETRLDWVAVDHWDTDNPHTHIVLNGHTGGPASGREDLVIAPDYMAHGMRTRASEIATEWLGPRTEAEIRQGLLREVDQQRLTGLDRVLIRQAGPEGINLTGNSRHPQSQNALRTRLQRLEGMGLAERIDANRWRLQAGMATTLDAMGQREDALETVRRALKGKLRECVVHEQPTYPSRVGLRARAWPTNCMTGAIWWSTASTDGRTT